LALNLNLHAQVRAHYNKIALFFNSDYSIYYWLTARHSPDSLITDKCSLRDAQPLNIFKQYFQVSILVNIQC